MGRTRGLRASLAALACVGAMGAVTPASAPADRAARVAGAGSASGPAPVPPGARALDTRHPDHVIGHGSPAGCTSAAVVRDVAAGGIITFDCGPRPVTI